MGTLITSMLCRIGIRSKTITPFSPDEYWPHRRVVIITRLPVDEFRALLHYEVEPSWSPAWTPLLILNPFGKNIGRLRSNRAFICLRPTSSYSWRTFVWVRWVEENGITKIACRFGVHPVILCFTVLMLIIGFVAAPILTLFVLTLGELYAAYERRRLTRWLKRLAVYY